MTSFLIDSTARYLHRSSLLSMPTSLNGGNSADVPDYRSSSPTFEAHTTPTRCSSGPYPNNSSSYSEQWDDAEFLVDEDETSFRVTIEMPGVRGKDIRVTVEDGVLTIRGYRRTLGTSSKKQRLQKRLFPVDNNVVDVTRAVATIWKDSLVLYAPKRSRLIKVVDIERECANYELSSPFADQHP